MNITAYTAAFLFNHNRSQVALIKKARPEWQKGNLNGIGGHIEEGETPESCNVREFEEETGLVTTQDQWRKFAIIQGDGFIVHFFECSRPYEASEIEIQHTDDAEPVDWYPSNLEVWGVPLKVISNLRWLIPLACDSQPLVTFDQSRGSEQRGSMGQGVEKAPA